MLLRLPRLLVLAVSALLLAGCGGDGDDRAGTTTSASGLEGASTAPLVVKGDATETALLTDVRAASHDGFDRVVFEFRDVAPGYDVRYVAAPVHADGSGEPVPVKGGSILLVRMEPALDADLSQESAPPTYTGATTIDPQTRAVVQLVRTGGFEAVLTWAVGVDEKRPFRVTTLSDPPRVVLDVTAP